MDHNAWCPVGPGKHGYMQVGLGRDLKLFNGERVEQHVFVGAGKFFLYCGLYHVQRVERLTKEEWETLPPKVRKIATRRSHHKQLWSTIKSAERVLEMYNSGELRAPLVRLHCKEFDTAFYQELVHANQLFWANKPRPAPPRAKRRKVADDDDAEKDEDD
ncbi:hypothetical protein C8Q74DRAFT_1185484, partial [Fomes fomentarius]